MAKGPGGRPTKYKVEMLEVVTELMSEGASKVEVSAAIDVSFETMAQWCNPDGLYYNEEFSAAIKKGLRLSQAWWERQGRTQLKDKDFSYTGWYMNMKNRFQWADKQETTLSGPNGGAIENKYTIEIVDVKND